MAEVLWRDAVRGVAIPEDFGIIWDLELTNRDTVALRLTEPYGVVLPLVLLDHRIATMVEYQILINELNILSNDPEFMRALALPALACLSHELGEAQVELWDMEESAKHVLDMGFVGVDAIARLTESSLFLTHITRGEYYAAYARVVAG